MSAIPPRSPTPTEAEIIRIGEGLLDRTLPFAHWTHAAHCIASLYLMIRRPDIDVAKSLPGIIWRYLLAIGTYLARMPGEHSLPEIVAAFLASGFAQRDLPLRYWSKDRLMSIEARRVWVEPDRHVLDLDTLPL